MLQSSASERPQCMPNMATIHYLIECQAHKSGSRSSKVTVGATPPSDLPSCQIWSVYLTNWGCSDSRKKRFLKRFCDLHLPQWQKTETKRTPQMNHTRHTDSSVSAGRRNENPQDRLNGNFTAGWISSCASNSAKTLQVMHHKITG